MDASDALRSGFGVLVSHPSGVFPFYLFAVSTILIARTALFVGGVLAVFVLARENRFAPVVREFRELDLSRIDPATTDLSELQGLIDALAGLVTPTTIVIAVVSFCCSVVLFALARSIAAAGTFHAVYAVLTGREPLSSGIAGIGRDTLRFIGLLVVRVGLAVLVTLPLVFVPTSGLVGVLLAVVVGLAWLLALVVIAIALLFVEPAVVVDDAGVFEAIRRSVGSVRHQPGTVVAYVAVVIAVAIVTVVLWGVLAYLSVSRVAALLTILVVLPYLDTVKVGLYADGTEPEGVPSVRSTGRRFVGAFRRGWSELGSFITGRPALPVLALSVLLVGVAAGWLAVSGLGVRLSPPADTADVFGPTPIDSLVQIAANNWLVAAFQTFAGVAFAVPTVTNLLFNGLVIGVVGGVFDPVAFLALVLPHGIIEIPAIAVAGGMGFHLGRVAWNSLRGRLTADEVAAEFRRAYYVLLGLAPLFVLAAFIEVFVTPWIASLALGG